MADELSNEDLRNELLARMEANQTVLLARIEQGESALIDRIEKVESNLEERLLLRIEQTETKLLNEFRKWSIPASGRMRTYEATLDEYRTRLLIIEERMDALEHGDPPATT